MPTYYHRTIPGKSITIGGGTERYFNLPSDIWTLEYGESPIGKRKAEQQKILSQYEAAQAKAREAAAAREAEIRELYDEIIERYGPTGAFGKGYEAQLERQKAREVAAGGQALVSSGLYGTTQLAGLGKKFEEEVGAPARLKLEDIRAERLSQAQIGKAGFVERIEDIYPDYAMMAKLMAQAFS